ncbi:MAG: prepilin-type N-terminal cleavage/methylation domain-containing protein [Bdellovibrionales bacterium]|nr:prepilin-type N-terminal cleavage/methylation domain-containing protein [Bdellovibrionales bacterium]
MSFFSNNKGMTLIEIMVVLLIIGSVISVIAPKIGGRRDQARAALRQLTVISKQLHTLAVLKQQTYRLAMRFSEDKSKPHQYWIESSSSKVTLRTAEGQKEYEDKMRGSKEQKPQAAFSKDTTLMKKERELPSGIFFKAVEVDGQAPILTGEAYVHFFPQGLGQMAAIRLTDRKNINWTIEVHPLTGDSKVHDEEVKLDDLKR